MIKMVITTAGRQALLNAAQTGTNAVQISRIGVGTGKYVPVASQTTLQAEIKRLTIAEGGTAGDNAFHVAYQDDSGDAYSIYEFGLFLNDGTLFAVYSSANMVLQKTASSIALLAVDIALEDINVSQITFGGVTYSQAAATTENAGIIALATNADVTEGSIAQKAVTPASLLARTATEARIGLIETATTAEATTGTDTTRAVTPAGTKAHVDARIATAAEVITGSNATKFVTPATLNGKTATDARIGLVELATTAETVTGTDTTRASTPEGVKAAITAGTPQATATVNGLVTLASAAEATSGTLTTKAVTPAGTKAHVDARIATAAEVITGSNATKFVTPATLNGKTATDARIGLVELATTAETVTGTDTTRASTPEGVKAAITAGTPQATATVNGLVTLASATEATSGTLTTKAVTPAGTKAHVDARIATTAEVAAGSNNTKFVTPAGLLARTGTDARIGLVELATNAEAAAGTDTARVVTPAGVRAAVTGFNSTINNATVVAAGATTARTLASRFADGITPKDFGAVGNGTASDQTAFTAFETAIKGRDVDLEGLTYLVTTRPAANNYYNGSFKIGNQTVKSVYDFYKFGGTSERFLNVRRDFSEFQRGGASLLAADYVRQGDAAGAVVQSAVWDDVNRYMYTLHTTSGDLGVVNRFSGSKFGAAVVNESTAYTVASWYLGHQGLGIQYMADGTVKLWCSMTYESAGSAVVSKGTKAIRFSPPTTDNFSVTSSVEIFNLFPAVEGSSQAVTVCTSYSGKYLIAKYNLSGNNYKIRIFRLEDLTTAGDYSDRFVHEFEITLTRDTSSGEVKALQGMACDDRYIYYLASSYGYSEKHSIYVTDMYGNVIDEFRDLSVGKEIGRDAGTTYYEPESLFFMSLNGQPKLVMQIATGDTVGRRLCQLIALNVRQSYFFPTGVGTGSYHGIAIDENGRMVNADGQDNGSIYPSGMSVDYKARAGTCQVAQARFDNGGSSAQYVFFKSRGPRVHSSASIQAGDAVGAIQFMADTGGINYADTTVGARVGYIEAIAQTAANITAGNLGVAGEFRFYVCSDSATSRAGRGVILRDNALYPSVTNALSLGLSNRLWTTVYATTGTIQTSDENEKQAITPIDDAVIRAWGRVQFSAFKFNDEAAEKGCSAPTHFGVVAQRVVEAFEAEGLDPFAYGVVVKEAQDDGTIRYGVRYAEALILEAAYQRQTIERLKNQLTALQAS